MLSALASQSQALNIREELVPTTAQHAHNRSQALVLSKA